MKSTRRCNKTVQTGRKSVRRSLGKGPHWPLSKLVGLEKRRLHGRRLLIEQLEPRQMLSFEPLSPLGSLMRRLRCRSAQEAWRWGDRALACWQGVLGTQVR